MQPSRAASSAALPLLVTLREPAVVTRKCRTHHRWIDGLKLRARCRRTALPSPPTRMKITDGTGVLNMSEKNTFETILKWIVVVILAFAALKVLLGVLGIAFFLGGVLLFRVLPIVLVVWLVVKAIEWLRSDRGSSPTSTLDV
jgi:hypothetical protein